MKDQSNKDSVYKKVGVSPGEKLPAYTQIGCYNILYITNRNSVICSDCANDCVSKTAKGELSDIVIDADVYLEGHNVYCEHCGMIIESSYD